MDDEEEPEAPSALVALLLGARRTTSGPLPRSSPVNYRPDAHRQPTHPQNDSDDLSSTIKRTASNAVQFFLQQDNYNNLLQQDLSNVALVSAGEDNYLTLMRGSIIPTSSNSSAAATNSTGSAAALATAPTGPSSWSLLMSALFFYKQPTDELQINWPNFALALILIMLMLTTAIGNLFVIVAILIERNLRTIGNYLVLSLAIADLLVACLVMPLAGIYQILESWTLGVLLCDIWTSADVFCCTGD